MRRYRSRTKRTAPQDVFERLSQRLEAAAERAGHYSNAERIRLLCAVMFPGEVEPERPDPTKPSE